MIVRGLGDHATILSDYTKGRRKMREVIDMIVGMSAVVKDATHGV